MGLEQVVDEALSYGDPARCNEAITEAHYLLSQALSCRTGHDAGANFHSWAVWGSQKAGVTIRQEDLTTALHDATWAGGCSGATVGLAVGHQLARLQGNGFWRALGLLTGGVCGSLSGRAIARWSRKKASRLILEGNRLVLDDIGRQTARFVTAENPMDFPQTVVQPLLRQAFHHYARAALSSDLSHKCQHTYYANLLAILHEHQKLQPYIASSMPFIVKRCVTKRLMQFEIGALSLSVSHDVPPLSEMRDFPDPLVNLDLPDLIAFLQRWEREPGSLRDSRATDWTQLEQRMRYIVGLFRRFHTDPSVIARPAHKTRQVICFQGGGTNEGP